MSIGQAERHSSADRVLAAEPDGSPFVALGFLSKDLDDRGLSPAANARYDRLTGWRRSPAGGLELCLEASVPLAPGHSHACIFSLLPVGEAAVIVAVAACAAGDQPAASRGDSAKGRPPWTSPADRFDLPLSESLRFACCVYPQGGFRYSVSVASSGLGSDRPLLVGGELDLNVGSAPQSAAVQLGPVGWMLSFSFDEDEVFYGLGEDFGPFVKNGHRRALINADALGNHEEYVYQNSPFLVSHRGRSLEVLADEPCVIDCGHRRHGILSVAQHVDRLALRVGLLADPAAAVRDLRSRLMVPRPAPAWSFGLWMSRCYYRDEGEIRTVLKEARHHGLPIGAINLDARCWMRASHRTDFVPDPDRYPDFFGLIADIRRQGVEVCLWENPYVSSLSELYDEGCEKGYFAKDDNGDPYPYQWVPSGLPGFPQTPVSGLVDFTNPAAGSWWQKHHLPFLKAGVKCFKTDFGEEIPWDAHFHDGRTGAALRNSYGDLYNLTVLEALRGVLGDEALVWARSGYRQVQATPVKWAGDGQTDWRSLRATLRAGLSQAFGGALFWSHDVGGFYGPPPDDELYLRWSQLAMWCSHVRCHGTTPREPWAFGAAVLPAFRQALAVRQALRSYFLHSYEWCLETQQSFLRPLILADQAPFAARWIDDMFWAGPDILVAPFLQAWGGRDVVLPPGDWMELGSGAVRSGPCELSVARTACLPVYMRTTSSFLADFCSARALVTHPPGVCP